MTWPARLPVGVPAAGVRAWPGSCGGRGWAGAWILAKAASTAAHLGPLDGPIAPPWGPRWGGEGADPPGACGGRGPQARAAGAGHRRGPGARPCRPGGSGGRPSRASGRGGLGGGQWRSARPACAAPSSISTAIWACRPARAALDDIGALARAVRLVPETTSAPSSRPGDHVRAIVPSRRPGPRRSSRPGDHVRAHQALFRARHDRRHQHPLWPPRDRGRVRAAAA